MERNGHQIHLTPILLWLLPAIVIITIAGIQPIFPVDELLRDAYAVAWSNNNQMKPHYGALSNVGLFIWAASAAICFFATAMFHTTGDRSRVKVFFFFGLFTLYILADDAFMLHETVVPHLGGAEEFVLAAIGIEAVAICYFFRRFFRGGELALLAAAVSLLGFSAAYDLIFSGHTENQVLIEDGAKFIGAWAWLGFIAGSAHEALNVNMSKLSPPSVIQ